MRGCKIPLGMPETGLNVPATPRDTVATTGSGDVSGTILAFDFGERFVGVAVGECEVASAHPLTTIATRDPAERFKAIAKLLEEWRPSLLVVGMPLDAEGDAHPLSARVERFARQLSGRCGLPPAFGDERFSSSAAQGDFAALGLDPRKHKSDLHPVAAQRILRSYFDDPSSRIAAPRR